MVAEERAKKRAEKDLSEEWYFTFLTHHEHSHRYVKIYGTYGHARERMFKKFGDKWAVQYSEKNFKQTIFTVTLWELGL